MARFLRIRMMRWRRTTHSNELAGEQPQPGAPANSSNLSRPRHVRESETLLLLSSAARRRPAFGNVRTSHGHLVRTRFARTLLVEWPNYATPCPSPPPPAFLKGRPPARSRAASPHPVSRVTKTHSHVLARIESSKPANCLLSCSLLESWRPRMSTTAATCCGKCSATTSGCDGGSR